MDTPENISTDCFNDVLMVFKCNSYCVYFVRVSEVKSNLGKLKLD